MTEQINLDLSNKKKLNLHLNINLKVNKKKQPVNEDVNENVNEAKVHSFKLNTPNIAALNDPTSSFDSKVYHIEIDNKDY